MIKLSSAAGSTAGCLYKVAVGIVCAECRPVVVGAEEDILIAAGFKRIVD